MNIYGTFSNENFLPQLLALLRSFHKKTIDSRIAVFALDNPTYIAISQMEFSRIDLYTIKDLENNYPELLAVKQNRSLSEYFFTITSAIPSYLMKFYPDCNFAVYLDADLYIFENPDLLLNQYPLSTNVVLTPHNFAKKDSRLLVYGEFNTGLIAFRINQIGSQVALWWLAQCLIWCKDQVEEGKFADQKYLEKFSEIFEGILKCQDFGLNLGPWGLNSLESVLTHEKHSFVNGHLLYVFHFSGVKWNSRWIILGNWPYRHRLKGAVFKITYGPYLQEIKSCESHLSQLGYPWSAGRVSKSLRDTRRVSIGVLLRAMMLGDIKSWRRVGV